MKEKKEDKQDYIHCPYCDFKSLTLRNINSHTLKEHLDKIDTNYNPDTGSWTYIDWKR